jgi:hypothetical protein
MDPNANLEELRTLVALILSEDEHEESDALRLAELVEALDGWIAGGGFLPAAWRRKAPGSRLEAPNHAPEPDAHEPS